MLYLACITISSADLAQYGVSLAKDWVSVKCGTMTFIYIELSIFLSFWTQITKKRALLEVLISVRICENAQTYVLLCESLLRTQHCMQ